MNLTGRTAELAVPNTSAAEGARERFELWEQGHVDFPFEDIAAVLDVDRFNFAMVGTHKEWQGITYVDVQRVDVDTRTK